jgi:hypothetical protein
MAYEARKSYPDSKLHITNEIIHNPSVNQVPFPLLDPHLLESGIKYAAVLNILGYLQPSEYSQLSVCGTPINDMTLGEAILLTLVQMLV